MYFRELRWKGLDWMHLAQDRDQWRAVVNTVMNLRVPYKATNFLSNRATVTFPGRTLLLAVTVRHR
jgi:hypothetical protein